MVEYNDVHLDTIFHALGDPTRRRMLRQLSRGERTVTELAAPFAMSLAAAAKHIKALEGAGLVRKEVRGRQHVCRLEARPLARASDWLGYYERFWTTRLDILERLLGEADANPDATVPPAPHAKAGARTNTNTDAARKAGAQPHARRRSPGKPKGKS